MFMSLASVATDNVLGMKMALRNRVGRACITFTSALELRPCVVLAFCAPLSRCSFGEMDACFWLSLPHLKIF